MPSRCWPVHSPTEEVEKTEPVRCACSRAVACQWPVCSLPASDSAISAADQKSPLALASSSPPSQERSASASQSAAGAPPAAWAKAVAAISIRAPMPVPSAGPIRVSASLS